MKQWKLSHYTSEEIPSGTFKSILRQADLIKEDFGMK